VRVELPIDVPFDYQLAMDRLAGFGAPRNKIRNLCRSGDLVRVKKGLYVAPTFPGRAPEVSPLVLAGLVYGPSYVSLESALAHHGLIPERVNEITSVTTKRAKRFDTPMAGSPTIRSVRPPTVTASHSLRPRAVPFSWLRRRRLSATASPGSDN
jgi:hypothetical protein